jgi:hypothetical protein
MVIINDYPQSLLHSKEAFSLCNTLSFKSRRNCKCTRLQDNHISYSYKANVAKIIIFSTFPVKDFVSFTQ